MKDVAHSARGAERVPDGAAPVTREGLSLLGFLEIADQLRERVAASLAEAGLSYPKYEVLQYLREAGSGVNLGCLAEEQKCARSNITQLIDRLEQEGLVRRVPDPNDRRRIQAELTELGLAGAVEGEKRMQVVLDAFSRSFSDQERAQLGALLARLE